MLAQKKVQNARGGKNKWDPNNCEIVFDTKSSKNERRNKHFPFATKSAALSFNYGKYFLSNRLQIDCTKCMKWAEVWCPWVQSVRSGCSNENGYIVEPIDDKSNSTITIFMLERVRALFLSIFLSISLCEIVCFAHLSRFVSYLSIHVPALIRLQRLYTLIHNSKFNFISIAQGHTTLAHSM